jgi:predicted Holliday junction resolvase-like endonuclease
MEITIILLVVILCLVALVFTQGGEITGLKREKKRLRNEVINLNARDESARRLYHEVSNENIELKKLVAILEEKAKRYQAWSAKPGNTGK